MRQVVPIKKKKYQVPKTGRHTPYIILIDWPHYGYYECKSQPRRQNRRRRQKVKITLRKLEQND